MTPIKHLLVVPLLEEGYARVLIPQPQFVLGPRVLVTVGAEDIKLPGGQLPQPLSFVVADRVPGEGESPGGQAVGPVHHGEQEGEREAEVEENHVQRVQWTHHRYSETPDSCEYG